MNSLIRGANFIETFRELTAVYGFGRRAAFTIAMRVHRGGGLTKDVVYLRGLTKLLDYLSDGGSLDTLLIGKIALDHVEFIEELRWREVLAPARVRPRYLDDAVACSRLARLRDGTTLQDLAAGLPQ